MKEKAVAEYSDDTLVMIDFNDDKVAFDTRYEDRELIDRMKNAPGCPAPLPKIEKLYGDMPFPPPPGDRPYTYSSIVLSSDGKMAFTDDPAGPVIAKNNYLDPEGALSDFWLLSALRANADGIIIGAKTLHTEPLTTCHIFDPELVEQRGKLRNKTEHPRNIIVSFDGTDVPMEHRIFRIADGQHFHAAIATSPAGGKYLGRKFGRKHFFIGPYERRPSGAELEKAREKLGPGGGVPVFLTGAGDMPDAEVLLYVLRQLGHEYLAVESPSYAAHLIKKAALDEMFINYSLVFAGGPITPNAGNAFSCTRHPHAALTSLALHDRHFMFTRQRMVYGADEKRGSNAKLREMKY
jgi:riboflavin biosynthesis pyrimidine reductase